MANVGERNLYPRGHVLLYVMSSYSDVTSSPRGYETFFVLNSAEHEIFSANKYENAIVGIFIFIGRELFMLSYA